MLTYNILFNLPRKVYAEGGKYKGEYYLHCRPTLSPLSTRAIHLFQAHPGPIGSDFRLGWAKKAAFAVLTTSRSLRPHFQSISIVVRIGLLIRKILQKSGLARQMMGWSAVLLEFDISYNLRGSIKSQVLANFVLEIPPTDQELLKKT